MMLTITNAMSDKDEEPAKPEDSDYGKSPNPAPGEQKTPAGKPQ